MRKEKAAEDSLSVFSMVRNRKVYIETYGCQMNVNDSEIVASLMEQNGFDMTGKADEADIILVNTCSIRENAELRVRGRLGEFAG